MTIKVLLFASAVDMAGQRSVVVDVPDEATLCDVSRAVAHAYPALSNLLQISRWALDREFVPLETVVTAESEVALIPPVSGG